MEVILSQNANLDAGTIANLIVAVATLLSVIVAVFAIRGAQKALEAQTFVNIQQRAERLGPNEEGYSALLDTVRAGIKKGGNESVTSYEELEQSDDDGLNARRVRALVDFFNDLAHLMRNGYVDEVVILRIYYPSILTCSYAFKDWWLDSWRKKQKDALSNLPEQKLSEFPTDLFYKNFELLCKYAEYLDYRNKKDISKNPPSWSTSWQGKFNIDKLIKKVPYSLFVKREM